MNSHTPFALLAVLMAVGITTISSAYAGLEDQGLPDACVGCNTANSILAAEERLLEHVPISVWADKDEYTHGDSIMLTGYVANANSDSQITVVVRNPMGSIVTIGQVGINTDREFEIALNTAGKLWQYDGLYTVQVQHGASANNVKVELVSSVDNPMMPIDDSMPDDIACAVDDLVIVDMCVPYEITGGMIDDAYVDMDEGSLVIMIDATDDGKLLLNLPEDVVSDIFMILVDNEESDDYHTMTEDGTTALKIMFGPETEMIEIYAEHVIPEFGTIAAMILVVAIVSVIAVSARTRLSIVPRL